MYSVRLLPSCDVEYVLCIACIFTLLTFAPTLRYCFEYVASMLTLVLRTHIFVVERGLRVVCMLTLVLRTVKLLSVFCV